MLAGLAGLSGLSGNPETNAARLTPVAHNVVFGQRVHPPLVVHVHRHRSALLAAPGQQHNRHPPGQRPHPVFGQHPIHQDQPVDVAREFAQRVGADRVIGSARCSAAASTPVPPRAPVHRG
jgi:hypothetical protein